MQAKSLLVHKKAAGLTCRFVPFDYLLSIIARTYVCVNDFINIFMINCSARHPVHQPGQSVPSNP